MDYYKELELERSASQSQIAQQYRRLSLIHHPSLSPLNLNHSYHKFCSVSEAYEVLSHSYTYSYFIYQQATGNKFMTSMAMRNSRMASLWMAN
jgi:DnaJ-class molecular chaperone